MNINHEVLNRKMKEKGIRSSYQRLRILEYLNSVESHPTVDEIYHALMADIPSLSKATIYNTLHTFVDAGLVRTLSIEDAELRYDYEIENHGHFQCQRCGSINNFKINIDEVSINGLQDFEIKEKNVYFKGLCPACQNKIK